MTVVRLLILALIVTIDANFLDRDCRCKAVSDTIHFPFHSKKISSCHLCGCDDAAMTKCEAACKSLVENYALTGCGLLWKDTQIKYHFEASNCHSGYGSEVFTCV